MMHSRWLRPVYDPDELTRTVLRVASAIDSLALPPKFIAVRGVSGVSVGAAVSFYTKLPLVVIRKDDEQTHSSGTVQGLFGMRGRYVIVDDLVDTGATVRAIVRALEDDDDNENGLNELVAIILYAPYDMQSETTVRLPNGILMKAIVVDRED